MSLLQNIGKNLYEVTHNVNNFVSDYIPDTLGIEGAIKEIPLKDIPQHFQNFKTKAEIDLAVLQSKQAAKKSIQQAPVVNPLSPTESVEQQVIAATSKPVENAAINNTNNKGFRLGATAKKYALPALGAAALLGGGAYLYNKYNQQTESNYSYMCNLVYI